MAGKTYKEHAVVLRKTKLGEKDLIVTVLEESGALGKAVAKGARKPGGSMAARIELFSTVDMLLAKGRNLDVVVEVRLDTNAGTAPFGLEQTACASPVAELVGAVAQEGLEQERLFPMVKSAFDHIRNARPRGALALCTAALLKIVGQVGFRPHFETCIACGNPIRGERGSSTRFSFEDGGVVCADCKAPSDAVPIMASTVSWCAYFMASRFDDIENAEIPEGEAFSCLHLARQWINVHVGRNLKSLDFLFTGGIY